MTSLPIGFTTKICTFYCLFLYTWSDIKKSWLIAPLTLKFSPSISPEKKIASSHTTVIASTYHTKQKTFKILSLMLYNERTSF